MHDHWWFHQRDMLTSHTFHRNQFGMSKSLPWEAGFQTNTSNGDRKILSSCGSSRSALSHFLHSYMNWKDFVHTLKQVLKCNWSKCWSSTEVWSKLFWTSTWCRYRWSKIQAHAKWLLSTWRSKWPDWHAVQWQRGAKKEAALWR